MSTFGASSGVTLFVAGDNWGNDAWSGSFAEPNAEKNDGPLKTLEGARNKIRSLNKAGKMPKGGVTVELRGGTYELKETFTLNKEDSDSGSEDAPIVYRARNCEKVRVVGGKEVKGFQPVTDRKILALLTPESRKNVLQANLWKQKIIDFGNITHDQGGLELFFQGKPMMLARWPNERFVHIADVPKNEQGKFIYEGDRPKRWMKEVEEREVWVHGYWFYDWSEERHKVKSIDPRQRIISLEKKVSSEHPYHRYGYRKGQWYYAFNILAELDNPGEWYLDRNTGILYFWPPGPIVEGHPTVSVVDTLIKMKNVSHVSFKGITFEMARGDGINITGGTHNSIVGCTLRNLGTWGVRIRGGMHNSVIDCDVYEVGKGGIELVGGNRLKLQPAGHYAENNHIHHYGRWRPMLLPAIWMEGVGHRARHNLIHNAPHMAIYFMGNEHLIEFNEIHSVCYQSNDAGAIYAGGNDWTMRGTVIRHNYLHHISGFQRKGCRGVYIDDMICGTTIYGNVFYQVMNWAVFIGGGRDCIVENNIFVDCPWALHIDARGIGWDKETIGAMTKKLQKMPYQKSPWTEHYPKLVNILEDKPVEPKGNIFARNIFHQCVVWGQEVTAIARDYVTFEDNLTNQDPHFVRCPPKSFQLRNDSPAYTLGFKPIPIEKIGQGV